MGRCGVRGVRGGELRALTYGVFASMALDPIEKKPLYHFHPGRDILSIGGWGCNFSCKYCQNYEISQNVLEGRSLTPDDLLRAAKREPANLGVAFTYNEPLIWYEFLHDSARLLKDADMRVVLVTNGYIEPEPLEELLPFVDAANVDLKSLDDTFYRELCGGQLDPVLEALRRFGTECHLEVTKLLVTGHTDPVDDAVAVAQWLSQEVGRHVPLHLSRYFPQHQWQSPETPMEVLDAAHEGASEHLDFVYIGNARRPKASDTHCPGCGETVIERSALGARITGLTDADACASCHTPIAIVRSPE